jgi:DNA-binding MarR family transcriptional regulator
MRAKHVALTERGRQLVEEVLAVHEAQIDAVMGGLTLPQQAELNRLLGRFEEHLRHVIAGGNSAGPD